MTALVVLILSIGLADSANPSTLLPALFLAAGKRSFRPTLAFALGFTGVNLVAGVILVAGPGHAILAAAPDIGDTTKHVAEIAAGALALIGAGVVWLRRSRARPARDAGAPRSGRAFIAGATIAAVELPTAVPYFAGIAAVVTSGRSLATQVALVVLFNLAISLPLFAIAALTLLPGAEARRRLGAVRARLLDRSYELLAGLLLAAAVVLFAVGAYGLATTR